MYDKRLFIFKNGEFMKKEDIITECGLRLKNKIGFTQLSNKINEDTFEDCFRIELKIPVKEYYNLREFYGKEYSEKIVANAVNELFIPFFHNLNMNSDEVYAMDKTQKIMDQARKIYKSSRVCGNYILVYEKRVQDVADKLEITQEEATNLIQNLCDGKI